MVIYGVDILKTLRGDPDSSQQIFAKGYKQHSHIYEETSNIESFEDDLVEFMVNYLFNLPTNNFDCQKKLKKLEQESVQDTDTRIRRLYRIEKYAPRQKQHRRYRSDQGQNRIQSQSFMMDKEEGLSRKQSPVNSRIGSQNQLPKISRQSQNSQNNSYNIEKDEQQEHNDAYDEFAMENEDSL